MSSSDASAFCVTLRNLVKDATEQRWTKTAVFFGEKLMTISLSEEDVYIFAQALFDNQEYRRAVSFISGRGYTLKSYKFAILVGRCLLECKAYEECLTTIGSEEENTPQIPHESTSSSLIASLYVVRARAWEGLENLKMATLWYKEALKREPVCFEAFSSLVSNHMLPYKEEQDLLLSLTGETTGLWIKALYQCLCSKYAESFETSLKQLKDVTPSPLEGSRTLQESHLPNRSHSESEHSSVQVTSESQQNTETEVTQTRSAGLEESIDVQVAKAEWCYFRGLYVDAYSITEKLIRIHPDVISIYTIHLGVCLELNKKGELYLVGQRLSKLSSESALTFYAAGVYYMCIKHYSEARRAFHRAQTRDQKFVPAWIGLGNAFAADCDAEQALAAYRKSQRLFPGLHLPDVYIGMENLRLNNIDVASVDFHSAFQLCGEDPLVHNQLGMVEYLNGNYEAAKMWFQRATGKIANNDHGSNWETLHVNYGHTLRKLQLYEEALLSYEKALRLCPRKASIYAAIGFTYHLQHRLTEATENYLLAISYDAHDPFAKEMLKIATQDSLEELSPTETGLHLR